MAASIQRLQICLQIIFLVFFISRVACRQLLFKNHHLNEQFKEFIIKYNKSYSDNETEYTKRFNIFKSNIDKAKVLNKDATAKSAVYGINKFSDMTPEEFNDKYLSGYRPKTSLQFEPFSLKLKTSSLNATGIPRKVDWRSKGVVTKIKNQDSCGACWAFTVAEVMETMLPIQFYGFKLETLSVQELIDCDPLESGCSGGDICSSTRWASHFGIVREKDYPLTDKTGTCKTISASVPRVRVHSYSCKRFINKEEEILSLLTKGPVAVAVDAKTWHSYVDGIIQFHCPSYINHAVVLVGYDLTGDVPYYIARNSWGTDFGDNGYLYIKVGNNLCGLASEVVFLTVDYPE